MARRPFNGPVNITQEYGARNSAYRKGYHTGVDYGLSTGTPVVSPTNGVVREVGYEASTTNGRGHFIVVQGDDGIAHCLYHLQSRPLVTSGRVSEGQHIGNSGNTGASSGPHLHWETRKAPFDGNSDIAPGSWLFAGAPVYQPPVNVPTPTRQFVRIFGDFRSLYRNPGSTKFAQLAPNQFGGRLDYMILARDGQFVKIQTQMYGQGWIYVGPDVASLTQFFNA